MSVTPCLHSKTHACSGADLELLHSGWDWIVSTSFSPTGQFFRICEVSATTCHSAPFFFAQPASCTILEQTGLFFVLSTLFLRIVPQNDRKWGIWSLKQILASNFYLSSGDSTGKLIIAINVGKRLLQPLYCTLLYSAKVKLFLAMETIGWHLARFT